MLRANEKSNGRVENAQGGGVTVLHWVVRDSLTEVTFKFKI